MSTASDARFWDRTSRKYATAAIADQAGYERTLDRTRALLGPDDRVLELGCGTGRISFPLARAGVSLIGVDRSAAMSDPWDHDGEPGTPEIGRWPGVVEALGRTRRRCAGAGPSRPAKC